MHKVDSFEMLQQKTIFATRHTEIHVLFSECMASVTELSLALGLKVRSVSHLDFTNFITQGGCLKIKNLMICLIKFQLMEYCPRTGLDKQNHKSGHIQ